MQRIRAPGDRLYCHWQYQPLAIKGLLFTGSRHAYSELCQVSWSDSNDTAAAGPTGCSGAPFTHRVNICMVWILILRSVWVWVFIACTNVHDTQNTEWMKATFLSRNKVSQSTFWQWLNAYKSRHCNDVQHIRDVSGYILHTEEIWIIQKNTNAMSQHVNLHSGIFGNGRYWWEWLWQLFN